MAYNNPGEVLTDIANSIRTLYGSTGSIPFVEMPELIKGAFMQPIDISGYSGTSWPLAFMEHLHFGSNIDYLFSYIDMDANTPSLSLDLGDFSTTGYTSFTELFAYSKFTSILGINNWDISNLQSMTRTFSNTVISGSLDLSNWDVSNVEFIHTFYEAKINNLNLSGWKINNGDLTDFFYVDTHYSYSPRNIQNADLSNWEIGSSISLTQMFRKANIGSLNLAGWDVSNAGGKGSMFEQAHIDSLDLTGWNLSGITSIASMFYRANIGSLDLTDWDTSNVTNMLNLFSAATVTKMWVPSTFVATAVTDSDYKPFSSGNLVIYTDATDAATQGWGTIGSNVVIHYNSTYQDFINA